MKAICDSFPLTDEEWAELEAKFGHLAYHAGWQLLRMNTRNNHTDDIEDVAQELRWSIYRAGCYTKRQVYIESCFAAVAGHVKDAVMKSVVKELQDLWDARTRHGANKVKYGTYQQEILDRIVATHVPEVERPDREKPLDLDVKFVRYCKAILWNSKKGMGKKITREKSWRSGLVSLSEHWHLQSA